MKPHILLAALPLALLAACDNPQGPGEGESRISLAYTGAATGTFSAGGDPDPTVATNAQTFAIGHRYTDGSFEVIAYSQRGGNRYDFASVTVPQAAVGTVSVERFCEQDVCPDVSLALDLQRATGSIAAHSCELETGTIRITALSATRASGSVSGSGYCNPGDGGELVPFQVTSGSFDVDVMQH